MDGEPASVVYRLGKEREKVPATKKRCQPPKLEKLASCPDLVAGTFFTSLYGPVEATDPSPFNGITQTSWVVESAR